MKRNVINILIIAIAICLGASSFVLGGIAKNGEGVNTGTEIKIGDYFLLGKNYEEPILWRCVDKDEHGPLMLSDKVICFMPFDAVGKGGSHERGAPRKTHGSGYWGDSNIRSWLNSAANSGEVEWLCGNPPRSELEYLSEYNYDYSDKKGFLADGNFTQSERILFKEVTQKTLLSKVDRTVATSGAEYGKELGADLTDIDLDTIIDRYDYIFAVEMTDRVFLLGYKQVFNIGQNAEVLGNYLVAFPTQKAVEHVMGKGYVDLVRKPNAENTIMYFMRSPTNYKIGGRDLSSSYGETVAVLKEYYATGEVIISSYSASSNYGIRPAFYLDTDNAVIFSGGGTKDDPYVIDGKSDANSEGNTNSNTNNNTNEVQKEGISVFINGTRLEFDQPPIMENDRVLVPMRAIFEKLGASVSWDEDTQTVTAKRGADTITMQIDNPVMTKNGEQHTLDVPPRLIGNRTLVPIRAVSESLGAKVEWLDGLQRVAINLDNIAVYDSKTNKFITYGMTKDEMIKSLGEPEKVGGGIASYYYYKGLTIVTKEGKIKMISVTFDEEDRYSISGIKKGTSKDEVLKKFGKNHEGEEAIFKKSLVYYFLYENNIITNVTDEYDTEEKAAAFTEKHGFENILSLIFNFDDEGNVKNVELGNII